jgi:uncharacterized protein (DUF2235 family)
MVAWNIDSHVMDGYQFLMQNCKYYSVVSFMLTYIAGVIDTEGDKISIFGFSRGAYTAQSLAGLLHKVGLLPADNLQQIPFAYKMYTRTSPSGWDQSSEFKKAFCTDVPIDFLGVWYDLIFSVWLTGHNLITAGTPLPPLD